MPAELAIDHCGDGERSAVLGRTSIRCAGLDCTIRRLGTSPTLRHQLRNPAPSRAGPWSGIVAKLCRGEVGAVFGLEVSRFGRSNADLTRLMELARLTDTLLIDADGVYDLTSPNRTASITVAA
ncbi:hypothetical protein [Micromonospora sp. NPDC047730]|uniref:hypothetical protein n=1 Tax=Micromonospora sp. NPDC047730 TaxID=3364253 RepID=UPI00371DF02E